MSLITQKSLKQKKLNYHNGSYNFINLSSNYLLYHNVHFWKDK